MEFKLTLKEVETLLQNHYQKTQDANAKVQIEIRKKQYGIYENDWMAEPHVVLSSEGNISGIPVIMTEDVTESIFTIIKNSVANSGYTVKEVNWDAGIKPVTTGYGMTERTDYQPFCNGLTIEVKTKQKVLGGL